MSTTGALMAAIGIYGLIQHAVSMRTKEIAICMAVGADTRNIFGWSSARGWR